MLLQIFSRKVSGSDLLSDTASFASLNIGFPQFVEDESFACIDVAQNANNRTPQLFL
jgi:hypothetical protein